MFKLETEYFEQLDEKLTLVPLTYDKAFKRIFRTNLDILKDFLKDVIPLDIDKECNIRLMDGELPKENMKEKGKIIDIYVVLDGKIYVDIEMNKSKFETVLQRNIKYKDKLSSMLPESNEDYKKLTSKKLYQLNLNAYPYEKILDDIIVLYGLKTHHIYSSDECMVVKSLERYRDLYYNKGNKEKDVIWLTILTSRTFTELYELSRQILSKEKVKKLMEAAISMSKDGFILHEWQKDKFDALVKYNEIEDAKKEGKSLGIEEGKSLGIEEGRALGKAEGTKEKAIEIAKNLIKENVDINIIVKSTGLTKKDINLLKENTDE